MRHCWLQVQVGGPEAAVFDYARGGPQFGADGLIIGPPQVQRHSIDGRCANAQNLLQSDRVSSDLHPQDELPTVPLKLIAGCSLSTDISDAYCAASPQVLAFKGEWVRFVV